MASSVIASGCKYEKIDDGRLEICWCEKSGCFLGKGSYGKVYKALTGASVEVAVKFPNGECHADYEIDILQRLEHRNILKYHRETQYGPLRYLLTLIYNCNNK